jgi:hypothetical protein
MELAKMKMLDFWRKAPKRLSSAPLKPVVFPLAGRNDPKPASMRSRARIADTDGRARRRNQLVEDNRLL